MVYSVQENATTLLKWQGQCGKRCVTDGQGLSRDKTAPQQHRLQGLHDIYQLYSEDTGILWRYRR